MESWNDQRGTLSFVQTDIRKNMPPISKLSLACCITLLLGACKDDKPEYYKSGTTMTELKVQSAKIEAENARKEAAKHPPPLLINASKLKMPWPFTIPSGSIVCLSDERIVFEASGRTYPLNGTAQGVASVNNWSAIEGIWKFDPEHKRYRVSASEVMSKAVSYCGI
jgi:hypothetical protein